MLILLQKSLPNLKHLLNRHLVVYLVSNVDTTTTTCIYDVCPDTQPAARSYMGLYSVYDVCP